MLAYILANTDKSLSSQINIDVEYTLLSRGSGVRIPPGSPKISTLLMQGVFYIFIKVKSLDSHFMV